MVKLLYHGEIKALTRKPFDICDAKDINGVFDYLKKTYGKGCVKEAKKMLIVVNGTSIQLKEGFKTKLGDEDAVSFLPVCGGG